MNGVVSRILVPIDFSTGSRKAWKTAQEMANTLGAELVLLHVLPATPIDLDARLRVEERRAELSALQAAHQLGVPRAYENDAPAPLRTVFELPLSDETLADFSEAGRAWALEIEAWATQARLRGCKVRTVLRVGTPYREIVDEATAEHVDLVVLATHGRGEIHRLLVGSVADRVIRLAPCPVMTVKQW